MINDIENMMLAQRLCPDALLVAGGIEAQFNYQTLLDKSPCKIVVLGEGEMPMTMIADGFSLDNIPGIVLRKDSIPFSNEQFWNATKNIEWEKIRYEDYWDFYIEKYRQKNDLTEERLDQIHTLRIFTRNRCPRNCRFCSSTNQLTWASGKLGVPIIDIMADQDLIGLIERIKKAHPRLRTIYFTDDDFCISKEKVIEFCKNVAAKNLGLRFIAFSRVNELDEEVLGWMSKAGFKVLNIGVESFSQKVLDEMNKNYNTSIAHDVLKLIKKNGILPFISIILITPDTELDDIEKTVDNLMPLIKDEVVVSSIAMSCIPFKGSEFYETTFDYMTDIIKIPGTIHRIKRHYAILANNPYVREVQVRFFNEINGVIERFIKERGVGHATSVNQALKRLEFMKELIAEARKKYNIKNGERGDLKRGELTASFISKNITKDKYQGI
ncbi:MAG: B12-binding domain-containing radical SAM protein [Candidatus Aenigmarchaeota archaeon]|nr:B12-binding domain-containing radical SAM protein [Candidatus Aenigmarchaeota archaeon]